MRRRERVLDRGLSRIWSTVVFSLQTRNVFCRELLFNSGLKDSRNCHHCGAVELVHCLLFFYRHYDTTTAKYEFRTMHQSTPRAELFQFIHPSGCKQSLHREQDFTWFLQKIWFNRPHVKWCRSFSLLFVSLAPIFIHFKIILKAWFKCDYKSLLFFGFCRLIVFALLCLVAYGASR